MIPADAVDHYLNFPVSVNVNIIMDRYAKNVDHTFPTKRVGVSACTADVCHGYSTPKHN